MTKISVEVYEINVKMVIIKKFWHMDNKVITAQLIKDKIQQGIEVPINNILVEIK